MSTPTPLPPKEDVASEIRRVASSLTNDMQEAALKKARELGFDLHRGRLSLEETLINIAYVRDILLDAGEQGKLVHLPLKLQYLLYTQATKITETLGSIINGTDAIQTLEDVTDDLTASAWQYNLHNLSKEVLGFQQKMNQLKTQETLIRKVHRAATEFATTAAQAQALVESIEATRTTATKERDAVNAAKEQAEVVLGKITEYEQKIAGLAVQAEQHDTAATNHEANAKNAAATAQAIAEKLPTTQADLEKATAVLGALTAQCTSLLTTTAEKAAASLDHLKEEYEKVTTTTTAEMVKRKEEIAAQAEQLQEAARRLSEGSAAQFDALETTHDSALTKTRDTVKTECEEAIAAVNDIATTTLAEQKVAFDQHLTDAKDEQKELVTELAKLEEQIRDSIRRATGFSLFHSFQTRQTELVKAKNFWAITLAVVVTISLCLSVGFIVYVNFVKEFGPAFYLKLSVSLPIIYAIWFCSLQYSRERRLEEEYAFKASISISLDPYRELVEKLVVKDKPEELAKYTAFIIESVTRVFTSPMETAFDHTKDPTPVDGTLKAAGELAMNIIKLVKKW